MQYQRRLGKCARHVSCFRSLLGNLLKTPHKNPPEEEGNFLKTPHKNPPEEEGNFLKTPHKNPPEEEELCSAHHVL